VRKLRWVSVVVVVCLAAAACGSRKTDNSSAPSTGGNASTTTVAAAPGSFGDLSNVCGAGNAAGATAEGVTDTEIRVGTISDPGATVAPGLDQEFFDTAKAFTDWCNAAGGIQGRKIKVDLLDAALFNYKDRITEACAQDFSLVGGGGVFDDTGVQDRVNCGLPDIAGYTVSSQATMADLMIQPIPNPIGSQQMGNYQFLVKSNPSLADGVGIMTAQITAGQVSAAKEKAAFEKLGAKVVYETQYSPAGEANWTPFVTAMKAAGVKTLAFIGESGNLVGLQKAMNDQGWYPDATVLDASFYKQVYPDTGGPTAKNSFTNIYFHPFADAAKYPATQQYLDILKASGPKNPPAMLGATAWSAWLMFAKSAAACGSNLTRDCLMTEAAKLTDWTGGGLHAKTQPAKNTMADCVAVLQVTDKGFTQVDPGSDGGFTCDPNNVVSVSIDAAPGAKKGG